MTGYDAATVEACVKVVASYRERQEAPYSRTAANLIAIAANIRALPIAPPAPLVTADDVAVKRYYPDDGGLKAPVREVGKPSPCFGVVLRHFRPDLHPPIVATPPQVTAEDMALIDGIEAMLATSATMPFGNEWIAFQGSLSQVLIKNAPRLLALARRAAPAADETELDRLRKALAELLKAVEGMIRLSDMGFAESMLEPEEDGNFVTYTRTKRAAEAARAALNHEGIA